MSNELVTKPNGAVGTLESDTGLTLSESEQIFPRLSLVQPTSREGNPGKWYLSVTGESLTSVQCVFFKNKLGRVMFNPDSTKMQAICGSDDRIVPADRYTTPQASRCVECPYHRRGYTTPFGDSKTQAYQCDETLLVIGYLTDMDLPFMWSARRTAIKPLAEFLTMVQFRASRAGNKACNYLAEMTTKQKDIPNKHYIPVIRLVKIIDDNYLNAMFNDLKQVDIDKALAETHGPSMDVEEVL